MQWLEPWSGVTERNGRAALEDELGRETGLRAVAVARRFDQDDVLFELADGRLAEVHLTWRMSPEPDARWPRMRYFPSLAAWVEARMMPDHQEWVASEGPHKLPPPANGWFPLAYSVNANRHLMRLSSTVDIQERLAAWRNDGTSWPEGLGALIAADTGTRIDVFAGSEPIDAIEFPFETLFPNFDRLPDGRWVVANARCWAGETNARILAPDGTLLSRIHLGDGIAHLQCDRMGGIWVGYFDEGIYGAGAAGDGEEPPGAYGINRFRPDGTISWSPGPGFYPSIDDCYAMNVGYHGVWLCYYSDFPIVHVPFDGVLRQWRNNTIRGASLVAVDKSLAVLLGGYEVEKGTGALLRLGDDGSTEVLHRFVLDPAMRVAIRDGLAFTRGTEFHFVADETWTIVSVEDFAEGLSQTPPRYPIYVSVPEDSKPAGGGWMLKPE